MAAELYRYEVLGRQRPDVLFLGRLSRYRYLNMDQVVAGSPHAFGRYADGRHGHCAAPLSA